ncbi:hypothetical protein DFQ26_006792 [Actinomortierella ambigua]|nr:hypothetical protein DFQ26_006792 [Actinomortierella ambigua]
MEEQYVQYHRRQQQPLRRHPQQQQQQQQQQQPLLLLADDAALERSRVRGGSPSSRLPLLRHESPLNDWSLMRGSIVRSPSEASYLDEDEDDENDCLSRDARDHTNEDGRSPRVPYRFSTPSSNERVTWSPTPDRPSTVRHHPYGHHHTHNYHHRYHPSSLRPASPHSIHEPRSMMPAVSRRFYEYERRQSSRDRDMAEYEDDDEEEEDDEDDYHYDYRKTDLKQERHSPESALKGQVLTGVHHSEEQGRAESSSKPSDATSSSAASGKPPTMDAAISLLQIRSASW